MTCSLRLAIKPFIHALPIVKLRNALEGRVLELIGTEGDNNAFIMCMGETMAVEFSKKGNAAYFYFKGQLDLDSTSRTTAIGTLKDRDRS